MKKKIKKAVHEATADMLDTLRMFSERIAELESRVWKEAELSARLQVLEGWDYKQLSANAIRATSQADRVYELCHHELRPVLGGHSVDLARFRQELDFINTNIKNIVDSVRTANNDISNQNSTLSHIHDTLNAAYERDQITQGHIQGMIHRLGRLENDLDSLSKTLFGKLELIVRSIVREEVDSAKKADDVPTPHTRRTVKKPPTPDLTKDPTS